MDDPSSEKHGQKQKQWFQTVIGKSFRRKQ